MYVSVPLNHDDIATAVNAQLDKCPAALHPDGQHIACWIWRGQPHMFDRWGMSVDAYLPKTYDDGLAVLRLYAISTEDLERVVNSVLDGIRLHGLDLGLVGDRMALLGVDARISYLSHACVPEELSNAT